MLRPRIRSQHTADYTMPTTTPDSQNPRLQKVLASAGFGSRRECEQLITEGRVDVDREIVTELGTRVDPASQAIRVDGVPLKQKRRSYFAVHKPNGVVSTSRDQWRRTRVIDLVDARDRVFTIGRLDKESSGLILVTNDGELANRLTHPRYEVAKVYHVTIVGTPPTEVLHKLRRGTVLAEGPVKPDSVTIKKRLKQSTMLEIVLKEGKNREIRRMLARVGHKVVKLHRVAMGPIKLGQLPKGAHRELSREEVRKLQSMLKDNAPARSSKPKKKRKSPRRVTGATGTKKKARRKPTTTFSDVPRMGAVLGGNAAEPTEKKKKTVKKSASGSKAGGKKATRKKSGGGRSATSRPGKQGGPRKKTAKRRGR